MKRTEGVFSTELDSVRGDGADFGDIIEAEAKECFGRGITMERAYVSEGELHKRPGFSKDQGPKDQKGGGQGSNPVS